MDRVSGKETQWTHVRRDYAAHIIIILPVFIRNTILFCWFISLFFILCFAFDREFESYLCDYKLIVTTDAYIGTASTYPIYRISWPAYTSHNIINVIFCLICAILLLLSSTFYTTFYGARANAKTGDYHAKLYNTAIRWVLDVSVHLLTFGLDFLLFACCLDRW